MAFKIEPMPVPGVLRITTQVFSDTRGHFVETYHQQRYAQHGLDREFVQDNHSHSVARTLRGLHYQLNHPQAKLIGVTRGKIFDVAADIRTGSPTYGQWVGQVLSAENGKQLYIPEGFAHGFCVLSKKADVHYKCTAFYVPEDDRGIAWNDPVLDVEWPVKDPLLSAKDGALPRLNDLSPAELPAYENR